MSFPTWGEIRSQAWDLLGTVGRELALVMRSGEVAYARVVGVGRVLRWGCLASEPVELSQVRRVSVVTSMRWAEVQRIAREQRDRERLAMRRPVEVPPKARKRRGGR